MIQYSNINSPNFFCTFYVTIIFKYSSPLYYIELFRINRSRNKSLTSHSNYNKKISLKNRLLSLVRLK